MDSECIQFIRYKLQKRLKRLNTADFQNFHHVLVQTWGFLQDNEITRGILDDLERRAQKEADEADLIMQGQTRVGDSERENDGICYWVVKKCSTLPAEEREIQIGHAFSSESKYEDCIETFRQIFIEPLFDYIDEQIDDKRITLVLLRKYKHRCEWFRRADLLARFKEHTRQGELTLAYDLYEYLHDQGVQFTIEPQSASGRIDLISHQTGKDRLVADVKIFNPERNLGVKHSSDGFNQVYQYTKDYNETVGYLVIFKTCAEDFSIATLFQESGTPLLTHNNKTIFLVVIDICDYDVSASKRGTLKVYELSPAQLIQSIPTENEPTAAESVNP